MGIIVPHPVDEDDSGDSPVDVGSTIDGVGSGGFVEVGSVEVCHLGVS